VRETHDAETGSETIEKNHGVVNGDESSTEVEREKKSGKLIMISCMVDRIREVNERGFS